MLPSCHKQNWRRARKEHKCIECGDQVAKGETYRITSGIWDGEGHEFKQCLLCAETFDMMLATGFYNDDGVTFGNLSEALREYGDYQYGTINPFVISDNLCLDAEHTAKLMG